MGVLRNGDKKGDETTDAVPDWFARLFSSASQEHGKEGSGVVELGHL
jgi:hypothetical protein